VGKKGSFYLCYEEIRQKGAKRKEELLPGEVMGENKKEEGKQAAIIRFDPYFVSKKVHATKKKG